MPTLIAEREVLCQKIRSLPDNAIAPVMSFVDSITIAGAEDYEPNEETAAVLRESADMRNLIGPFSNMEDFMASLLSDDDA